MLKLTLLPILFFAVLGTVSAQILDPVIATVKYNIIYINDGKTLVSDQCQLDITKNRSYFFSLGVLESIRRFEIKSNQARQSNTPLRLSGDEFPNNLFRFNTLKDYMKDQVIVLEFIGDETLACVTDTLSARKWEILDDVATISGLQCRKAKSKSGNTTVTAWFCIDIPFRDGPLFYYGLPGLIVKLENSMGWTANLFSVAYSGPIKKGLSIDNYRLVSSDQFKKAKKVSESMGSNGKIPHGGFSREN
jgi:GLPGLI family protein